MRITILGCLAFFLIQAVEAPPKPASIEGFVRRLGTGEPIFNARVMISGLPTPLYAFTEKDGHFAFTDLAPGKYTLIAFANSYVRVSYGQKAQNLPSTPIVLVAGQQVKDVVF